MEKKANIGKIVAKAWTDPKFEKELLSDPAATLRKEGISVPPNMKIRVMKDDEHTRTYVLPPKPKGELSEKDLEKVAGGVNWGESNAPQGKGT